MLQEAESMRDGKSSATRIAAILLAIIVSLPASSRWAEASTGRVQMRLAKAGFVVGVGRITGTLHLHGRNYPLEIAGISAGTIGIGIARLAGHAYHLRSAADIVGSYTVASASVAVAAGKKVVRLQKSNSIVYLQLQGPQVGLELSATVGGITISLR